MKVLIIYTGGTIGMAQNKEGVLVPADLIHFQSFLPKEVINRVNLQFTTTLDLKDSSEIKHQDWIEIVSIIEDNYSKFEGFLILHGTDTITYTASAISFMLQGLGKPVIFTGSQLPIGAKGSDAINNFSNALNYLMLGTQSENLLQEVCICFNNKLINATKAIKRHSYEFDAFASIGYPLLGEDGKIQPQHFKIQSATILSVRKKVSTQISIITEYPNISVNIYKSILDYSIHKAVILEAFGMGNIDLTSEKKSIIKNYLSDGGLLIIKSQCYEGGTNLITYESGNELLKLGATETKQQTREAIYTQLCILIGMNDDLGKIKTLL